jgi:hypothetical protein
LIRADRYKFLRTRMFRRGAAASMSK